MIASISPLLSSFLRIFLLLRFSIPLSRMPEPKVVTRGSVASIINNLHKLEYESGRMNEPPQLRSHHTLTADHPAQKPMGDRPVPFQERPHLQHHETEGRGLEKPSHRFGAPDLHHFEEKKPNLFRRRDSTGSEVRAPTPQRRETRSHRAFEMVRSMSLSPPLVMPVPRVEIHPWNETAEQYIARKLTERWSSPTCSRVVSHSSRFKAKSSNPHVDAPFAQELLLHIDNILTEHTGTLRGVIEDSSRMLHDRQLQCYESGSDQSGSCSLSNREGHDETSTTSSSVPDLIAAIDRTASHLGLSLPEHRFPHPGKQISSGKHEQKAKSPVPSLEHITLQQPHVVQDESDSYHRHGTASPAAYVAIQTGHHVHKDTSPFPAFHDSTHPLYQSSFHATPPHSPHYQPHDPKFFDPSPSTIHRTLLPHVDIIQHHHSLSPSPALIEYDRFAALADRASRNSINDLISTSSLEAGKTASRKASSPSVLPVHEHLYELPHSQREPSPTTPPKQDIAQEKQEKPNPNSSKLKDSWVQRRSEGSDKAQIKRQTTMEKLRREKGYQGHVSDRVKQAAVTTSDGTIIKSIAGVGKRQTERMVASIMTRQGRDKERANGWKN